MVIFGDLFSLKSYNVTQIILVLTQNLQGQNQEGRATGLFFGFPMLNTGSSDPVEILFSMLKQSPSITQFTVPDLTHLVLSLAGSQFSVLANRINKLSVQN